MPILIKWLIKLRVRMKYTYCKLAEMALQRDHKKVIEKIKNNKYKRFGFLLRPLIYFRRYIYIV